MSSAFTEFVLEEAALAWLHSAGWRIRKRVEIALSEPTVGRDDYGHVVLPQYLRHALLQQLISGELRGQEVQRAVKEATA